MKVFKFGGSSVGNAERIESVKNIVVSSLEEEKSIAVVFSAFQGVTDTIIKISQLAESGDLAYKSEFEFLRERHQNVINELKIDGYTELKQNIESYFNEFENLLYGVFILHELTQRTKARLLSYGEILSCTIIAEYFNESGINAEFVDARKIIKTNDLFEKAKVDFETTNKLIKNRLSDENKVYVITGFTGSTKHNETTTLGRGGSDYTASIVGAAIDTEEIVIWTDVDGIMTADPNKVADVRTVKAVTYEEAIELSYFGAKVIHPPTMLPALAKKIKLRIKNTFNPAHKGTVIIEREPTIKFNLKGISSIDNISILRVKGGGMRSIERTIARIFSALAGSDISVLLITQGSSGNSISIAITPDSAIKAQEALSSEFRLELLQNELEEISILENHSIIAIVGEDMIDTPGVSGKVFQALGKNGINIVATAQGSSQLNISVVVRKEQLRKALNVLHDSLGLSNEKIINVFMVGPGLVGSELIERFMEREQKLRESMNIRVKIIGLANSKKMLINADGISLDTWKENLYSSGQVSDMESFIAQMTQMNLSNAIFVDCTATDRLVPKYSTVLSHSISVVTPNKIANTLKQNVYEKIKAEADKHNVQFRYSTNVGAGLPFIELIKDRTSCGDKIIEIQAVLSGSLSYIFNSLGKKQFYDVVKKAQQSGFTEPDPRDDLSGKDAARKLLILLRESGLALELENVEVESLVPEKADSEEVSVDDFWKILETEQFDINSRRDQALTENKKLCYIASYQDGLAKAGIKLIDATHPFYNLSGSENIIFIRTEVYDDIPLVIRGNGAGAKVTSYGVFDDIIRIAKYLG